MADGRCKKCGDAFAVEGTPAQLSKAPYTASGAWKQVDRCSKACAKKWKREGSGNLWQPVQLIPEPSRRATVPTTGPQQRPQQAARSCQTEHAPPIVQTFDEFRQPRRVLQKRPPPSHPPLPNAPPAHQPPAHQSPAECAGHERASLHA
eukprot:3758643-Prymnesium_polylepis.2